MTDERVYLVTGCASGIGWHVASQLAERGARAYLTDKNFGALREVARQEGWDAARLKVRGLEVTTVLQNLLNSVLSCGSVRRPNVSRVFYLRNTASPAI